LDGYIPLEQHAALVVFPYQAFYSRAYVAADRYDVLLAAGRMDEMSPVGRFI
jgi:hypothetical protein